MTPLDTVLRHAITSPTFDQTKINRERLVDTLHANIPRKLIVIAAPAGYGKTTLLANFSVDSEIPVCWMRLTEADRDVIRFVTLLAASLQRRFRRLRDKFDLERLIDSSPQAIARAFADTIDAHISDPFVILLDDVHLINRAKATTAFLDALLEILPEQITVVASGREVLEVSLARLMAEGNLFGIGPQELALTPGELTDLARLHAGVELEETEATRLLEETRGWITGVVLSGKLTGTGLGALVQDPRPMVYEYLASVVLNRQPDDLRRFMLDTCVFPVMTADGCDFLLKADNSTRFLRRLVRGSLFLTATEESPRTYEYHPQFRQFLLELTKSTDKAQFQKLQKRAADYLAQHDSPEHAVELYVEAGANKKAAIIADVRAEDMYTSGRWITLETWAQRLGEVDVVAPRVFLYLAAAYTERGNLDAAEEALVRGQIMLTPKTTKSVLAYASIVRGHIALRRGIWDEVIEAAEAAEEVLSSRGSKLRRADCRRLRALANTRKGELLSAERDAEIAIQLLNSPELRNAQASALVDLSMIQVYLGKLTASHATTLKAHDILLQIGSPVKLAVSYNNLAYDAHLQGRYEEALDLYNEGLKFARQAASPAREANILFGQADLFADLDLALQAAELYGEGLNLATQLDNLGLIRYGCIRTSILHRRKGGTALAHEWLGRAIELGEESVPLSTESIQLCALEAFAKPERAKERLAKLVKTQDSLEASDRTLALYFQARASLSSGAMDEAHAIFKDALDWGGGRGTEQFIAGELLFDPDFREFVRHSLGTHPVLSVILRRIEMMRAVAQLYQEAPEEVTGTVHVTLSALGEASVYSQNERLSDLKPLSKEVLFHLADHQRVERDVLLETFWPHHPPGRQVANLHTAVYNLRRELGRDVILHEGTVYCLNAELPIEYDVLRFERAASIAEGLPPGDPRKMFALTEAINSYGGPFLLEFASDWVVERRRDLEIRYLDLLAHHAQEALVRDQPLRAVNTLRQALQIDPYRDDTNLYFLEALGRLGRRGEVVAHYQRYIKLLAEELGLDPPERVRELYSRLID
jgi:ATP/maltotriose-dependent transcriptional regulator MalT/DNA-binding SARP family transcriptional activator